MQEITVPTYELVLKNKASNKFERTTVRSESIEAACERINPAAYDIHNFRCIDDPAPAAPAPEPTRPATPAGGAKGYAVDSETGLPVELHWKHAPVSLLTGRQLYRLVRNAVAMGIIFAAIILSGPLGCVVWGLLRSAAQEISPAPSRFAP